MSFNPHVMDRRTNEHHRHRLMAELDTHLQVVRIRELIVRGYVNPSKCTGHLLCTEMIDSHRLGHCIYHRRDHPYVPDHEYEDEYRRSLFDWWIDVCVFNALPRVIAQLIWDVYHSLYEPPPLLLLPPYTPGHLCVFAQAYNVLRISASLAGFPYLG